MSFSLADLGSFILSWILVYGAIILCVAILLGSVGVPLPTTFLLLAAGAFVRQDALNLPITLICALVGAILGDSIGYGVGRLARGPIFRRYGQLPAWNSAEAYLQRRGSVAIYLTRWLITPLAAITNLVAGSGAYPYPRFLLFVVMGEATWVLAYGALGYAFSDQWESINALISNFGGLLVGAILLIAGIIMLVRGTMRTPVTPSGKPPTSAAK
jgi:membrane protein DedA with SNARE-associated domain